MKKGINIVYIALFFCFCFIPGIAMAFDKTETVANEVAAEMPVLVVDGKLNPQFHEQVSDYVDKNFGFRQELITANSLLRSILCDSGNEKVILGRDGWLFFEETVKDYTGQRTMSGREVFCAAQNLETMQKSAEAKGSSFFFTIAPNKNSLYGAYMPKHYLENRKDSNYAALKPYLTNMDCYIDLFGAFESEEEILYFKQDSHWNSAGALLARDEILKAMGRTGRSYTSIERHTEQTHRGDLYEMAYPKSDRLEEDVHYNLENRFSYLYKVRDNDEPLIETTCGQGEGKLIFFRDSFGTALLPYLADEFEEAWFSKETPYSFAYAENYFPGTVLIELVERNLEELCKTAPIMEAPACSDVVLTEAEVIKADFSVTKEEEMYRICCSSGEEIGETDLCYILWQKDSVRQIYQPFYLENNCFELRIPAEEDVPEAEDFILYIKKGQTYE